MRPRVVLIGPPGSGKTSVGEALAVRWGIDHRDTDADVERVAGKSVSDIFVDEGWIAQRGSGECLGEIALLRDSPRTATVIAATPLRLVELTSSDFLSGALAHPRSVYAADGLVEERLRVGG